MTWRSNRVDDAIRMMSSTVQKIHCVTALVIDKQQGVCLGLYKSKLKDVGGKAVVPCPGCLLKTIERSIEDELGPQNRSAQSSKLSWTDCHEEKHS